MWEENVASLCCEVSLVGVTYFLCFAQVLFFINALFRWSTMIFNILIVISAADFIYLLSMNSWMKWKYLQIQMKC